MAAGGLSPRLSTSWIRCHQQRQEAEEEAEGGGGGRGTADGGGNHRRRSEMTWQPHLLQRRGRKMGAPPVGLRNLGNTCYLNSVLQCLTYTPPLANFCLQFHHSSICEKLRQQGPNGDDGKKKRDCPFCVLERRIARSLSLDAASDVPSKVSSCLCLYASHFQWGHQEDAHEFLRYVIDSCHNTCLALKDQQQQSQQPGGGGGVINKKSGSRSSGNSSSSREKTVVEDIFGGALLSQVRCLSCGSVSNKTDEIMDVSLDLFQSRSLNDALRRFFQPEFLDGDNKYNCSRCNKLSAAKKHMLIQQAPNVLVIQLKRFEGIHRAKINRDIMFEEVLSLSNFMSTASQVTNTPWGERVNFVFRPGRDEVAKPLHVSPFMDMLGTWKIHADAPGEKLHIMISVQHPTFGNFFTATLGAKRVSDPISPAAVASYFWLMPHKVAVWIYWHALKLWWKGVSFVSHPKYLYPTYREDASTRERELNRSCSSYSANADNKLIKDRWCIWRDAPWPWS